MEKICALNSRNSFLKNKFAALSSFKDNQGLSEQSLNLVILCLSVQRKLTHFYKELKRRSFLCLQMWKKQTNLDKELKHRFYFFSYF